MADVRFTLRRTAGEIKRYRSYRKLIPIGIVLLLLLLILEYVISALYSKFGAFTVMVNKLDNIEYALSLSENRDFTYKTSRLSADIDIQVTNIDGSEIPDWVDNVDGKHNGRNYIAYTFYCMNAGTTTVAYTYELYLTNMEQNMEKAIRVRLYVDGVATDYAYPRTDGIEGPEPGTTAFLTGSTVVKQEIGNFRPGDITKYTVVVWLEGNDPECTDQIVGGTIKIDMSMNIVGSDEKTN